MGNFVGKLPFKQIKPAKVSTMSLTVNYNFTDVIEMNILSAYINCELFRLMNISPRYLANQMKI